MNALPPPPPPATNTKKKKRPAKIKDASAAPPVASFDPPSSDADPTTPKRAKKKARDAAAAADTTSYLMVGLNKCGVEENFLKSGIGLIGETKREELEGRLKEIQEAEAELSVKRTELIVDQVLLIMDYPLSSTDAEGGATNESKPQPEKYLAELLQLDPHFGTYPEDILMKGLENIRVSMWAELQVKWRHLQDAEWELELKRNNLVGYYFKLLIKAASK